MKSFATYCSSCGGVLNLQSIWSGESSILGVVASGWSKVRTSFAKCHSE